MQIAIRFALRSPDGTPIDSAVYGTIHALGSRPRRSASRRGQPPPRPFRSAAKGRACNRGSRCEFSRSACRSGQHTTHARLRVPAWHVPQGTAPAVFLPPGPFTAVADGYLRAELKGNYRFSLEGQGTATFVDQRCHDLRRPATLGGDRQRVRPTSLLRKGYNRLRLSYASPPKAMPRCGCFGAATNSSRNCCRPRLCSTTPPIRSCSPPEQRARTRPVRRRAAAQTVTPCRAN